MRLHEKIKTHNDRLIVSDTIILAFPFHLSLPRNAGVRQTMHKGPLNMTLLNKATLYFRALEMALMIQHEVSASYYNDS